MRRAVVTGVGLITAIGNNPHAFWGNLVRRVSGIGPIQGFDVSDCPTRIGAQVTDLKPEARFAPKLASRLSRVSQLGLLAAGEALDSARLAPGEMCTPVGVWIGCAQGGFVSAEESYREHYSGKPVPTLGVVLSMNSAVASNIAIQHGLRGPLLTIDTACSSAAHAIGLASQAVRAGFVDVAVAGGADTVFSPVPFRGWCALRVMTTLNETPASACKPFSKNRDGMVLGEGAAMVVLEAKDSARARSATILAEVAGYGSTSDAQHITHPAPEGAANAIMLALHDARLTPAEVDYVNAHATGTRINDEVETVAIKTALAEHAYRVAVSGIKQLTGHTLAAAGAIEAVACILSIQNGEIPPTANYDEADPRCDLDYVVEGPRRQHVEVCLSNSFGFGGSNAVLVIRGYR